MKKKVMLAMSGGVDSSVALLLLKDKFDVVGVTLKLFENEDICQKNSKTCCSLSDVEDRNNFVQHTLYEVIRNEIDLLLYFRDPLTPKPHEPNELNLLRLCDVHNIPLATNIATAEALIHALERGDLDWRDIIKVSKF